ncbi:MAG: helix-turn-helix domain-containing protein [Candidatus Fimousia sp.]
MATLPERLVQLQTEHKLLKKDIAEAVGISTMAYYRYESGKRLPDVAILTKLADFYNISTDYLLGRSDDPTRH